MASELADSSSALLAIMWAQIIIEKELRAGCTQDSGFRRRVPAPDRRPGVRDDDGCRRRVHDRRCLQQPLTGVCAAVGASRARRASLNRLSSGVRVRDSGLAVGWHASGPTTAREKTQVTTPTRRHCAAASLGLRCRFLSGQRTKDAHPRPDDLP